MVLRNHLVECQAVLARSEPQLEEAVLEAADMPVLARLLHFVHVVAERLVHWVHDECLQFVD